MPPKDYWTKGVHTESQDLIEKLRGITQDGIEAGDWVEREVHDLIWNFLWWYNDRIWPIWEMEPDE